MEHKNSWFRENLAKPIVGLSIIALPFFSSAEEKSQEFSHKIENVLAPLDEGKKLRKEVKKLESEYEKYLENIFKNIPIEQKDSIKSLQTSFIEATDSLEVIENKYKELKKQRNALSNQIGFEKERQILVKKMFDLDPEKEKWMNKKNQIIKDLEAYVYSIMGDVLQKKKECEEKIQTLIKEYNKEGNESSITYSPKLPIVPGELF